MISKKHEHGLTAWPPGMLPLYYRARGWDESGRPEPHKLAELGLE